MQNQRDRALIKHFAGANLKLVFSKRPLGGAANKDVFGLTITRTIKGVARSEVFTIWPGADDNRVEVVNTDPIRCQLVMMVQEARREVSHHITASQAKEPQFMIPRAATGVRKNHDGSIDFKTFAPSQKRHMLMGVDERQLFIAQLPRGITTVDSAHKSLKTSTVTLAEGKVPGRTIRQGEWFFLNVPTNEIKAIDKGIRDNKLFVLKKTPIGRAAGIPQGHPHTADEIVFLPGKPLEHGFSVHSPDVFVRGKVRHQDHKTVSFKQWRRVIKNSETPGNRFGNWID